jgi:hypothetical protein
MPKLNLDDKPKNKVKISELKKYYKFSFISKRGKLFPAEYVVNGIQKCSKQVKLYYYNEDNMQIIIREFPPDKEVELISDVSSADWGLERNTTTLNNESNT